MGLKKLIYLICASHFTTKIIFDELRSQYTLISMIDPQCRKGVEKFLCCCVRDRDPEQEFVDYGNFEAIPIRIGEFILFYGRRRSVFPFHCLLGPDWFLNGIIP